MISAIILAAGESKRMGAQNKLLLPFGEKTLIENIVDTVLASQVSEVIVVLGHESARIRDVLRNRKVRFAINLDFEEGMTTSIQTGVRTISPQAKGFMICLSDLLFIKVKEFNKLLHAFEKDLTKNEYSIVLPSFQGQRGNPVIFSVSYKSAILEHRGKNGCRGVIKQNPEHVFEQVMETANILKDIDTKEDYQSLLLNQ